MIKRLYDWMIRMAEAPNAMWVLALVCFVESSFFPIPPYVLMIPMVIARPSKAFVIAGVATLSSVAGAILGYYIGAVLLETVGRPVLAFYGKGADFDAFAVTYNQWGFWAILGSAITPIPFKVITIASGATGMNIPTFLLACLGARGFRFFVVAGLLWKFGAPIRDFIERWLGLVFAAFCVLLIGGFYLVRFL